MWLRGLLELGQLQAYAKAYLHLSRAGTKQPTPDQIVAQLAFGFWTTILSKPYHHTLWTPDNTALVKAVFPYLPPTPNNRNAIHQRYNDLRLLRNRVMHHEPIWKGINTGKNGFVALSDLHSHMIEEIGWVNPIARTSIEVIDRFDNVLDTGKEKIERGLRDRFDTSIPVTSL